MMSIMFFDVFYILIISLIFILYKLLVALNTHAYPYTYVHVGVH
jgi:hypothetical protein